MSVRLALEMLGARNAPSNVVGNSVASTDWLTAPEPADQLPAYSGTYDGGSGGQSPPNNQPVINNFRVVLINGGLARYSGTVSDESAAGMSVVITGAQACLGNGKTVTTDAEGYFQWDGPVQQTVDAGPAYADTTDPQGLEAESATDTLFV